MADAAGVTGRRPALLLLAASALLAAGCLAPSGGGVRVWAADDTTDVRAATPPDVTNAIYSQATQTIAFDAAINETIAFQLVCRTDAPRGGPFDVTIGDLTGPAGTLSAERFITRYRAQPVAVADFPSWFADQQPLPLAPTAVFDELVPWDAPRGGGPLTLDAGENAIVWVDVRIPPTAEPGPYEAEVLLRSIGRDARTAARLTLRVRVLPVALPTKPTLPIVCRVAPHDLLAEHLNWDVAPGPALPLLPAEPSHAAAVALIDGAMQLLHGCRLNPVLWAAFPRLQLGGTVGVRVDWSHYDALVGGWIDGSAYPDRVAAQHWPLPASVRHPDAARNGGVRSTGYAQLLGDYLRACEAHFAERGWTEQSFLRLAPPATLDAPRIDALEQLLGVARHNRIAAPLVAHAPVRSLRGLGWFAAPEQDLVGVDCWAPPAQWYEPTAIASEHALGRHSWLVPSHPPYSGSLALGAAPTDVRSLAWQAFRYGDAAIWIEHAVDEGGATPPLVYPGRPRGLYDRPIPSMRLQRLRRAAQDHALLTLLQRAGQPLLAQRLSEHIVPYAYADACREHLLSTLPAAWPRTSQAFALARTLALQELANALAPTDEGVADQLRNQTQWQLLRGQAQALRAESAGVRLSDAHTHMQMHLRASVFNGGVDTARTRWSLADLPPGWRAAESPALNVPPGQQRQAELTAQISTISYNRDGAYPLRLHCDIADGGRILLAPRLAVAVAPLVDHGIRVDGDLSDWPLGLNNAAGDFLLVRGERPTAPAEQPRAPTAPTRAYFCNDGAHLYVAIRCGLSGGETPLWRADNAVPMDGAIPWGQDVCELLLCPSNALAGLPSDLYLLQIKPTGLLVARRGCPTNPPIGASEPWNSGARVAVAQDREAWTVELSIPLESFGMGARQRRLWGVNVTRLDARRGEYASWSGATGHCYGPEKLGNLMLLRP